jgi:rhomboid-like protein
VGVVGASFGLATIWQYESYVRKKWKFNEWIKYQKKRNTIRDQANQWWQGLNDGEKMTITMAAANLLVVGAWRVPVFHRTLLKYFLLVPVQKPLLSPMILSAFSHQSLFHWGCNMYVVYTFSRLIGDRLGKEQFAALYLSSAVCGSLFGLTHKVLAGVMGGSLGASGAVMGIIAYTCVTDPESRIAIMFLPFLNFSAGTALKGILAFDFLGMFYRKSIFDHAAHLGGASFGIFYALYGQHIYMEKRTQFIKWWHELRTSSSGRQ